MLHNNWTSSGWIWMTLAMVALWGIGAWIVVPMLKRSPGPARSARSAHEILAERLARGEISLDEYEQQLRTADSVDRGH